MNPFRCPEPENPKPQSSKGSLKGTLIGPFKEPSEIPEKEPL